MKRIAYQLACLLVIWSVPARTQVAANGSRYDSHDLFSPLFYPQSGNAYRTGSGEPGPLYWQNRADYSISAALDEVNNQVSGTVTMTYKNNSPQVLPYIWMQLDQNLFNSASRGYAKLPATGRSRYGDGKNPFQGGYKISAVKILQTDATGKGKETPAEYLITDTRMQIRLDRALQPRGDVTRIRIDYSYTVPDHGADRTGVMKNPKGNIYAIAQWYPRVCVYDDIQGWNTQPYLGASEFYLEYGDFDVSITTPSGHIVVASGELVNPEEVLTPEQLKRFNQSKNSDATVAIRTQQEVGDEKANPVKSSLTWKFRLQHARDFAWAASRSFIWDASRIKLASGKTAHAQSVYPPSSAGQEAWGRSTEFVRASIANYSRRWVEYPYPAAVNVASNIGGMEYPGIIFCGAQSKGESLWGVTDHELGHTWFPMMVGSNERKYGWMDEGFNTFINSISASDFNNGEFSESPINGHQVARYMFGEQSESILNTPDGMKEMNIGLALYFKPGYALMLLRNHITDSVRFDYAFRKYIRDWSYKHPSPWDFFRSMENSLGEDLGWFWKGMFLENYRLDQAVERVDYINNNPSNGAIVTVNNLERMAMPLVLEWTTKSGTKTRKSLPVEIWQNNATYQFRIDSREEITAVEIDPDQVFPDYNSGNNKWKGK